MQFLLCLLKQFYFFKVCFLLFLLFGFVHLFLLNSVIQAVMSDLVLNVHVCKSVHPLSNFLLVQDLNETCDFGFGSQLHTA